MADRAPSASSQRPRWVGFDRETYAWKPDVDYRVHPEAYRVGRGEQGVLIVEPYKSELVPLWRFKTAALARQSSEALTKTFKAYLLAEDFVGADMSRKFLQMGYTRARRYANYKGGRKYQDDKDFSPLPRGTGSTEKAESAAIFHAAWKEAEANPIYAEAKKRWKREKG